MADQSTIPAAPGPKDRGNLLEASRRCEDLAAIIQRLHPLLTGVSMATLNMIGQAMGALYAASVLLAHEADPTIDVEGSIRSLADFIRANGNNGGNGTA